MFSSCTVTLPAFGVRKPKSMSTSSFWPLPSTPAMPRISPRRTSKEILSSIFLCHSLTYSTSRTRSTTSVGCALSFCTFRMTSRPTISREISSFVTSQVLYTPIERPPRMMVSRSVISMISLSLWEMKTIV